MSRYVDAEKIELRLPTFKDGQGEVYVPLSEVKKCISLTPTEDVVPVVRCKDCFWWDKEGRCENPVNGLVREYTGENDYCSCARKGV